MLIVHFEQSSIACLECVCPLNSKTILALSSIKPSLIFHFHQLPSPVHTTGFFFYIFPNFLAMFILLSSNNNYLSITSISTRVCNLCMSQIIFQNSFESYLSRYVFFLCRAGINLWRHENVFERLASLEKMR